MPLTLDKSQSNNNNIIENRKEINPSTGEKWNQKELNSINSGSIIRDQGDDENSNNVKRDVICGAIIKFSHIRAYFSSHTNLRNFIFVENVK
jgi:hypothetical protein